MPISSIVSNYIDLPTSSTSSASLVCRCPFHDDKSPSLSLNNDRGLYHCFSCKASGDVISFVQNIEKISFTEALSKLASLSGLAFDPARTSLSAADQAKYKQRDRTELVKNSPTQVMRACPLN